jgi:hypothetical protein
MLMPTFPTYPGELPSCLNPLNLRHYFLLAYWVFFRPTALKCYLYQAAPKLYRSSAGPSIFRTLWVRVYRNLYGVALGATVLVAMLIGVPIVAGVPILLVVSGLQGTAPDWYGVALGGGIGVALGVTVGLTVGVALGVVFGVTVGVA